MGDTLDTRWRVWWEEGFLVRGCLVVDRFLGLGPFFLPLRPTWLLSSAGPLPYSCSPCTSLAEPSWSSRTGSAYSTIHKES